MVSKLADEIHQVEQRMDRKQREQENKAKDSQLLLNEMKAKHDKCQKMLEKEARARLQAEAETERSVFDL